MVNCSQHIEGASRNPVVYSLLRTTLLTPKITYMLHSSYPFYCPHAIVNQFTPNRINLLMDCINGSEKVPDRCSGKKGNTHDKAFASQVSISIGHSEKSLASPYPFVCKPSPLFQKLTNTIRWFIHGML